MKWTRGWKAAGRWRTEVRVVLAVALVLCAALGVWAYSVHRDTQALGNQVYRELDGDGLPVPKGTLDDPVFSDLPLPTDRPVSLGRYKPPVVSTPPIRKLPAPPAEKQPVKTQPAGKQPVKTQPAEKQPIKKQPTETQPTETQPTETQQVQKQPVSKQPAEKQQNAPERPQDAVPLTPAPAPALAPAQFTERLKTNARIHLLLIANDQETLGSGRGDVLLVLTLDPQAQMMTLLSIPRDTRVNIPEMGLVKINAAYGAGGATAQVQAVERFLGIPMDKYVEISLGGFREAIDLVGGVDVNPKFSFQLDGSVFRPGKVHVNGEQALAYARMRKDDPQGDLGRNVRQQEVVRQLMGMLGRRSTADLQSLLNQLSAHLRTNFSPSEVVRLRTVHAYMLEHQRTKRVQGVNRKIGGIWFYVVSDAERRRLHLLLR